MQMNGSTAIVLLLHLVVHGLINMPRIFQNIWKLGLLKYETENFATQFQL